MFDYTFQLARTSEAPHLAAMSRELIEAGLKPSWPASRIRAHIQHADSVVLTAKMGREIAGFALMQFGDDTAHLNLLAVAPAHQRRGVARRLLRWLEETAMTAGCFLISLELRATNVAAYAFYAAMGYQETTRINGYYQGIEQAIRMSRDLRAGSGALRA
ncbi:MAG TPA: GNAT family N-acetyltransferase [Steroidobacteraceae bacterium]